MYRYLQDNGGSSAFELTPVHWFETEAEAYEGECLLIQFCLEQGIPLLNQDRGGHGGVRGWKHTPETLNELGRIQRERCLDPAYRARLVAQITSDKAVSRKGEILAQLLKDHAYRRNLSEKHRERFRRMPEEERMTFTRKAIEAIRGKPCPPEVRARISEAHLRWWQEHPEARERVGSWRRGQKHTLETRQRLGEKRRSLTNEQALRCRQLQAEGLPLKRIGELLGVSTKAVFNAVHGNGIYATVS